MGTFLGNGIYNYIHVSSENTSVLELMHLNFYHLFKKILISYCLRPRNLFFLCIAEGPHIIIFFNNSLKGEYETFLRKRAECIEGFLNLSLIFLLTPWVLIFINHCEI